MTTQDDTASIVRVTLTLLSEGDGEADIALTTAIGLDVSKELRTRGDRLATAESSTTTRGGDFIVTVITTVTQLAADAWTHREAIEHVLNDANTLVSLCKDAIAPIVLAIAHAHKKQQVPAAATGTVQPIRVTIEIDHKPVMVEAVDEQQIEAGLRIAQQFYERYSQDAARVTAKSKVKVQGQIPAQKKRKRQ
jgi:hypothetical protein